MDSNLASSRSRRGYLNIRLINFFRNSEARSYSSIFTIQLFLAFPLSLSMPKFSPLFRQRFKRPQQMDDSSSGSSYNTFDTYLLERAQIAENRLYSALQGFLEALNKHQFFNQFRLLAAERPIMLLTLAVAVSVAAFPMLLFVGITAVSMLFTILGFILFQGTLLTVATLVTGSLLAVAACVAVPMAVLLAVAYLVTALLAYAYTSAFKLGHTIATQATTAGRDPNNCVIGGQIKSGRSLVPVCVLESDIILSKRLAAANGCSSISSGRLLESTRTEALIQEEKHSGSI